jgi:hypothetical protein
MSVNKSIIFYLDTNLEVYQANLVNSELKKIAELKKEGKTLNLFSNFALLWSQIFNNEIKNTEQITFLIASNASFTDTRIIYIWLKSNLIFSKIQLKIINTSEPYTENPTKIIDLMKLTGSKDLTYSGQPRIGKNNFKNPKKPIL